MADISKIQLKGTNDEEVVYNIKDETARNEIIDINNQVENNTNKIQTLSNKNNGFELNLQNFSIHDIGNDKRIQGICVDTNNNAYVYNETNFPFGDLLVYNLVSNSFVSKIENLKLYHGNDLTFLNNKLYIASTKDVNGNLTNRNICISHLFFRTKTSGFINKLSIMEKV